MPNPRIPRDWRYLAPPPPTRDPNPGPLARLLRWLWARC